MRCISCNAVLKPIDGSSAEYQFDNALWIGFHGGYGMFIDPMKRSPILGANEEAVLCHECAHSLCDKIPWINKLLDPYSSHAHTKQYHKNNPDHYGWDYDVEW